MTEIGELQQKCAVFWETNVEMVDSACVYVYIHVEMVLA